MSEEENPVERLNKELNKQLTILQLRLLLTGNFCELCWTNSWEPASKDDPGAYKLRDSEQYVACAHCALVESLIKRTRGESMNREIVLQQIAEFPDQNIQVLYTNYKHQTRIREVRPLRIHYGSNEYHPEPQWLLDVWDLEKNEGRSFALKDCDFSIKPD